MGQRRAAQSRTSRKLTAVKRTDTLFATARVINGPDFAERPRVRRERSAPLVTEPGTWLPEKCLRWSCSASVAHPIDQMLRRWEWLEGVTDQVERWKSVGEHEDCEGHEMEAGQR